MKKLGERLMLAEMPLEQFIFVVAAVSASIMAIIGAIANIPLGLAAISSIILSIDIVLCIGGIIYSLRTKKWVGPSIIAVSYTAFVAFPMLWYTTGGATGSTMPYIIVLGLVIAVMFKGKLRLFYSIAIPVLFAAVIIVEMLFPDIIIPYANRASHYTDLTIGLVVSFAAAVALTINVMRRYHTAMLESEALVKKLNEISITDPLTGIYNRRLLTSCLDEEMRKCYETNQPMTICIIDIDHFKQVNDIYGHLCGDKVLVETANLLEKFMKEDDILGRYGGEEFLIIFKNQTLHEALTKVEAANKAIQDYVWEEIDHITVSGGVSEYVKGISYSDFVGAADKLLYHAKETGRNRISYKRT